ncbi:MAG: IS1595 family transposase, partial [Methylococcaceae bacterium]|nr:IS1595 family transposase [Methylococcaceae bacterium]
NLGLPWRSMFLTEAIWRFHARCRSFSGCFRTRQHVRHTLSARDGAMASSVLVVAPGATLLTDDWSGYAKLDERGYCHTAVAERGDRQVAGRFLPIIHLVFSNLKTCLRGIHHGVSPQHLQTCLNEFTFRFNRRFYPFNAFRSLPGIAGDVTAPTYADLYPAKSRLTTSSRCV